MAITATVGSATADAFCTVAEADTYHQYDQVHTYAAWSALTTAEKEAGIKMATRIIDAYRFSGYRTTTTQALSWPRELVYVDSVLVSNSVVPDEIKWATAEMANWLVAEDRFEAGAGHKLEEVKVGSIEARFRFTAGGVTYDMPDIVVHYLKRYVEGSPRGGVGFAKVRV